MCLKDESWQWLNVPLIHFQIHGLEAAVVSWLGHRNGDVTFKPTVWQPPDFCSSSFLSDFRSIQFPIQSLCAWYTYSDSLWGTEAWLIYPLSLYGLIFSDKYRWELQENQSPSVRCHLPQMSAPSRKSSCQMAKIKYSGLYLVLLPILIHGIYFY